jgi:hypothetical protein
VRNCQVMLLQLKHEKNVQKNLKYALATPNSSDLSSRTRCKHSQYHATFPWSNVDGIKDNLTGIKELKVVYSWISEKAYLETARFPLNF